MAEGFAVSGRPLEEGALYTVEERLETFQVSYCHWPFDSGPCTPLKVRFKYYITSIIIS